MKRGRKMSFKEGDLVQMGTKPKTYRVTKVLKNGWLRLETLDGSYKFKQHDHRDDINPAQGESEEDE